MSNCFRIIIVLVMTVSSLACAESIQIRAAYWKPDISGDGSAKVGGVDITTTDLDDADVDSKVLVYEATMNFNDRNHLFGGYWEVGFEGEATTAGGAGEVIPDAKLMFYQIGYQYDLVSTKKLGIGLVLDAHFYEIDVDFVSADTGEKIASGGSDPFVTLAGLAIDLDLTDNTSVSLKGEGRIYGDGDEVYDFRGDVIWSFAQNMQIFGGYRIMQMKSDMDGFDLDATLEGPYVGIQIEY
jgi:hypothetical protein